MLMLAAPCWAVRGIVPPFQYRSPSCHDWTGRGSLPGFVVNTIASSSSVACQAWYCAPKQPARKSWALDSIAPDDRYVIVSTSDSRPTLIWQRNPYASCWAAAGSPPTASTSALYGRNNSVSHRVCRSIAASVWGTSCQAVSAPRSHQNSMSSGSVYDTSGTRDTGVGVNGSSTSSGMPMCSRSVYGSRWCATRSSTAGSRYREALARAVDVASPRLGNGWSLVPNATFRAPNTSWSSARLLSFMYDRPWVTPTLPCSWFSARSYSTTSSIAAARRARSGAPSSVSSSSGSMSFA